MTLILSPLQLELEALKSALGARSDVMLAIGGHGKVQFALSTLHMISELKPELVICAGSCGALSRSLNPFDVVIAAETIEHDFKLGFVERPLPSFAASAQHLQKLHSISNGSKFDFALHIDTVASGDEDIVDPTHAANLAQRTKAVAVAWEGAGGARACRFAKVPFLEIRGVTDMANSSAIEIFKQNLPRAMQNVAQVIHQLLD